MPLYNFTLHNVSNVNIDTPLRVILSMVFITIFLFFIEPLNIWLHFSRKWIKRENVPIFKYFEDQYLISSLPVTTTSQLIPITQP